MRMKCCPKCGSTNLNSLIFYRPSTWVCLDCGYEGAFIIENSNLTEQAPERYQTGRYIIDLMEGEPRMDGRDGSTDDWQRILGYLT